MEEFLGFFTFSKSMTSGICLNVGCKKSKIKIENIPNFLKNCKKNSRKTQEKLKKNSSLYSIIFIFSVICRICVKYAHLVHLLHFYLPQGANFQKFYSKGSILPGSACTCREKRSGKEGKHPSTSTSSLVTTLQSVMNAKLSEHRFWHCHDSGLVKTIQTIPHYL